MHLADHRRLLLLCGTLACSAVPGFAHAGDLRTSTSRLVHEGREPSRAVLRVRTAERSPDKIPRYITGKFAEHLGWNIYKGMDAQILLNPTFADYPFWTGQMSPDGVTKFHVEDSRINEELRRAATRFGWPETELDGLVQARGDALACFWTRVGSREAVQLSPDTGPHGGRAQRVAVKEAGEGVAQWVWLPLHRVRRFEFEIMARSPEVKELTVTLASAEASVDRESSRAFTSAATVKGLSSQWKKLRGQLGLPDEARADGRYKLSVLANSPGQLVLRHVFLWPADHLRGADPDVVRFLRESRLPILRWPGGNFVSTYHWDDGIGPLERRPTKPNFAWGGLELNTFGTDEFIAFCRAVGCEPMICINAGSGTPEEAARWVEYCNGPPSSPLGRLRAANGHRQPYRVKHWEVGNELWGRWQMYWSTAAGYADRYRQFAQAMLKADPTITLYACGAPVMWGKEWNDTLIARTADIMRVTTDHPLVGGNVPPSTEPLDVYRDFMAVPEVLEQRWAALRDDMRRAGIKDPRLAVTELQLFAHLGRASDPNAPVRLTRDSLPSQATITEAIYNVLLYHACVRLAPFVTMVTHSATVNHGGGLRKDRERVWANPCHYAQAMFAAFSEAHPVALEIESVVERAPMVLPDLKNAAKEASFSAIDALAAVAPDGSLLLSIVHRGTSGEVNLSVEMPDFRAAHSAELRTLSADVPWAANTLEQPQAVTPADSTAPIRDGRLELQVKPFSVLRVRIPKT
jgi:alpha-N-arabinofuranosidase